MYINIEKKKKSTKKLKVLRIDVHGKVIKKRKFYNSFFFLYGNLILSQFLQLNLLFESKQTENILNFSLKKYIDKYVLYKKILIQIIRSNSKKIKYFFSNNEINYFIKFNEKKKMEVISSKLFEKYVKNNENSDIFIKNDIRSRRKFMINKIFFYLYFSVTKHQYVSYLKKSFGKKGVYINNFFNFIESRLDMLLYRSFSNLSIEFIKQIILHKKIYINNKKISYSSFLLKKNDIISFFNFENLNNLSFFVQIYKYMLAQIINYNYNFFIYKYPNYIFVDFNFLFIIFFNNKFIYNSIPNFFKFDFKSYSKLLFL